MQPNHLSVLGIIHTAISVLAIIAGIISLVQTGVIDPKGRYGKYYIVLTIITCLTGFPIMKTGHPSPGHILGVLIIVLFIVSLVPPILRIFGNKAAYVQVVILSGTLFLSFIPAINETLSRLPVSHPIATGPDDPIIKTGSLILLVLYIVGATYQVIKLRSFKKTHA